MTTKSHKRFGAIRHLLLNDAANLKALPAAFKKGLEITNYL
tara:strand:+ start:838 stop:960 length:123 start_codon:yes stop_codon:yes gene_type:complete